MYTVNTNTKQNRFAKIAKMGEILFHAGDLAVLWNIQNPETLYTTISRYVKQGLLYRIYKGLYGIDTPDKIDPFLIGVKAIHGYAYVSLESVLFREGILNQKNQYITIVSGKSAKFEIVGRSYYSRQMKEEFLFNSAGISKKGGVLYASVERAVADLYYFNSGTFLDNPGAVDWEKVQEIQKAVGYPLLKKGDKK